MRSLALWLPLVMLAACDKPNDRQPETAMATIIAWDEARGDFLVGGEPAATVQTWTGPDGVEALNAKAAAAPGGGLAVTGPADDPGVRMTLAKPFKGVAGPLVLVRLTRVRAAGPWDGSVFYSTGWHGESARFTARPASEPAVGTPVTLVYDMGRPAAGDWRKSTIESLRMDLEAGGGGDVIIHRISIVRNPL